MVTISLTTGSPSELLEDLVEEELAMQLLPVALNRLNGFGVILVLWIEGEDDIHVLQRRYIRQTWERICWTLRWSCDERHGGRPSNALPLGDCIV